MNAIQRAARHACVRVWHRALIKVYLFGIWIMNKQWDGNPLTFNGVPRTQSRRESGVPIPVCLSLTVILWRIHSTEAPVSCHVSGCSATISGGRRTGSSSSSSCNCGTGQSICSFILFWRVFFLHLLLFFFSKFYTFYTEKMRRKKTKN